MALQAVAECLSGISISATGFCFLLAKASPDKLNTEQISGIALMGVIGNKGAVTITINNKWRTIDLSGKLCRRHFRTQARRRELATAAMATPNSISE
jgi:predicted permease